MELSVAIMFSLLALACSGHPTDRHMICKTVNDVTGTGVARRRNIGPPRNPGLPGIRGEKGLQGAKGQSGEVDYERLEEIVCARVSEETRDLESKVNELEAKIQNMTPTIPAMCDGVIYGGRCYWGEVYFSQDTTNAEAQESCTKRRSRLANIYSKDHYDSVMLYLRSKLNGSSSMGVWTGMGKTYGNPSAQLSDNTQAPYTKARSHSSLWNTASRDRTHVYLLVRESDTDSDQGMAAVPASWKFNGALCQSQ